MQGDEEDVDWVQGAPLSQDRVHPPTRVDVNLDCLWFSIEISYHLGRDQRRGSDGQTWAESG